MRFPEWDIGTRISAEAKTKDEAYAIVKREAQMRGYSIRAISTWLMETTGIWKAEALCFAQKVKEFLGVVV